MKLRRLVLISVLAGTMSVLGCGDDETGTGGTGGTGATGGSGATGGTGGTGGSGGTAGTGGMAGMGGTGGTAGSGGTAGTGGMAGMGGTGGTAGSGGTAGTGGMAGMGGTGATGGTGGSDLSVQVSWEPFPPCVQFTRSDWEVTVEVTGEVGPVTVEGSVVGCTGPIDMLGGNTISCPNNSLYPGTVSVSDDMGTDEVSFMMGNCTSGSAP